MASLDRCLTNALIANFADLTRLRRGQGSADEDRQALTSAVLRLKGEALRLKYRIDARERAGGPLKSSLARQDRTRLRTTQRQIEQLEELLERDDF